MKKLFFCLLILIFFPLFIVWAVVIIRYLIKQHKIESKFDDLKIPSKDELGEWIVGALESMGEEAASKIEEKVDVLEETRNKRHETRVPKKKIKVASLANTSKLSDRQKKILSKFDKNNKIGMKDLYGDFSEISQRTLRRDMDKLEQFGFLLQKGKTRDSYYEKNN